MANKLAQKNEIEYSDTLIIYGAEGTTSDGKITAKAIVDEALSQVGNNFSEKEVIVNNTVTDYTIDEANQDQIMKISNSVILTAQTLEAVTGGVKSKTFTIYNDSGSVSAIDATTNSITVANTSDSNISANGLIAVIYIANDTVIISGNTEA